MAADRALGRLQQRGGSGELRHHRQLQDSARVLRAAAAARGGHADGVPAGRTDRVRSGSVRYARTAGCCAAARDAYVGHTGLAHEARRRHSGARARTAGAVEYVPGGADLIDESTPVMVRLKPDATYGSIRDGPAEAGRHVWIDTRWSG